MSISITHICTSWSGCMFVSSKDPVFDLAKHERQVCHIFPTYSSTYSLLGVGYEERQHWCLGEEPYTFERSESVIWGTLIFFWKICKTSELISWSRYEWLCTCYTTILSLNHPRQVKLYAPRIRWKVRTLPTCSTHGRVLCCMFAISWEYNIVATPDQPT